MITPGSEDYWMFYLLNEGEGTVPPVGTSLLTSQINDQLTSQTGDNLTSND